MRVMIQLMLVFALVLGQIPISVFAQTAITQNVLATGSYTIEQDVLKSDSDEASSAGKFLQTESALEVTEAGMKLTLTYTAGSLMSNLKVRVNGEEVDFTQEVNGSGMTSTLALTFDIKDLSDEISMDMTIMGTMNHTVRILLKEETLKSVSEDESDEVESGNTGSGSGSDEVEDENSGDQEDKVVYYTIEQNVFKPGTTEVSMAGDFLKQESKIKETKDKKELTLTFNMGNMISGIKVRVNGKEVAVKQRLVGEGDDSTLSLTFEIDSVNDKISMDMTIMGFMNHTVDIVLKPETLKQVSADDIIENDSITGSVGGNGSSGNMVITGETLTQGSNSQTDKTPTVTESQLVSVNDLVEGQTYIIKNDVYSSVSTPRQALNASSYLEVKNEAYYVTFGFGLMDYMNNLRISVNGSQVSYDVLRSTATTMDLKFKMNSLTDKIMVTAYVPAISRDVTFEVKLLTNAIYTISANQANQGLGKDTVMQMSTDVEEEEEVAEELEVSDYIKRYSIKNEVLSDSELGLSMARKYLNEESLLEEVDGVLYLSLTLSGTDMMQNIRFKVNGEIVDHELTLDDTENHYKTYRFILGSVEDEIEALMYIIPSGRDISFGIRLLPETQTLLSETTLEVQAEVELNDEEIEALADEIQAKEIKQNNADVMMAAIISMGTLSVVGASVYFIYKKKNKTKA